MDCGDPCAMSCLDVEGNNLEPSEATKEDLRQELLKYIRDQKYLSTLNSKLAKGEYRMRKDQLFRRLQVEKDERTLQECMWKEAQEKEHRRTQICQEEEFAKAIQMLKEDEVREAAIRKQLYACAPEIRELERELRRAYYAKTLYAQRLEGEAHKLEEKMREQEMYDMFLGQLSKRDEEERLRQEAECRKKREYHEALTNQLQDATSRVAKKQNEFQKDKEMIDEIVATIQKEELDDLMEKNEKVKLYQSEIKHFLDSREYHRQREKDRIKRENENIKEFVEKKEAQVSAFNKAKAERDAAKAAIVAKAIERIMQDQFKNEELEDLRRELYEEELAEEVRRREEEEKAKRLRQMKELQQAEADAKRLRAEKLEADRLEEEEYRRQLIAQFAEEERLEQMGNQKRRQREREHRKKIEEMILERRALKAQEREKQLETRHCFDEETEKRKKLIEDERFKLLREHGPKLLGFIPRGVIKSAEELEKLGEPFLSYYRNAPRVPDPSTIDFEPCEEEIFKNMDVPRYIKF